MQKKTQGKAIIKDFLLKMAPSRENGLPKTHASMLHAVCACNYIHLPLTRQHKQSVFVSRFASSRHFQYKTDYNASALLSRTDAGNKHSMIPYLPVLRKSVVK